MTNSIKHWAPVLLFCLIFILIFSPVGQSQSGNRVFKLLGLGQETAVAGETVTINTYLPIVMRQVYHVAVDGSDETGIGSVASPWATIGHAVNNVGSGATILVQPGTYNGEIDLEPKFTGNEVTIISAVPYQAKLRHNDTVITCYRCQGIIIEGFDIAHTDNNAGQYVIQIQDAAGNGQAGTRITLRNNIIHDSYNNDLLKVNNGADDVLIEGNMFYNQAGPDSHIDVNSATNVTIQDNVFFNDFAGSGRSILGTASFITIKDSNGTDDANLGSHDIFVRRNVFLNWEGSNSNNFIVVGEDKVTYFQAYDILIENNLFLGNSSDTLRAAFGAQGVRDVTFRHNTVVGDLPGKAFAMLVKIQDNNPNNNNIAFYNNIWSDPTGTMGAQSPTDSNDFSDSPPAETDSFTLQNNLYWNGGTAVPSDPDELINYTDDAQAIIADPLLATQAGIVIPRWVESSNQFADGSTTIQTAFINLVQTYGTPQSGSPAINTADPSQSPTEDILKNPRPISQTDMGAYEQP